MYLKVRYMLELFSQKKIHSSEHKYYCVIIVPDEKEATNHYSKIE